MPATRSVYFAIACVQLLLFSEARSYCYDHQTATYHARFTPADCTRTCTVTPFFSPDNSIETYINLIESARESIDIYTPAFKSWSNCTHTDDCRRKTCTGCSIENQRNEPFPVFPALLNAIHERGVTVRILTNNYTKTIDACADKVTPLDWLALNNVHIRLYTTTTFQHAKFIVIDKGTKTAISSVNWSYTSFMKNREAGVILEDCTCSAITFYQSVFEYDWDNGVKYTPTRAYSPPEIKIITNTSHMPYIILKGNRVPGAFVTKLIPRSNVEIKKVYTSPDYARDTLMTSLRNVKHSLSLAIFQVTDKGLCDELLTLSQRGVNVTVLVSRSVIPFYNYHLATECYMKLYNGGMEGRLQKSYSKFRFSHEKYWIIDGTTVHLSTGNWSPSDFPSGTSWQPHKESDKSINRDLQIVMEQADLVAYFATVYNADWAMGEEWKPKTHMEATYG